MPTSEGGENGPGDRQNIVGALTQSVPYLENQNPGKPKPRLLLMKHTDCGLSFTLPGLRTCVVSKCIRLTDGELRGQVVVLDFWTYCCINCMHILSNDEASAHLHCASRAERA